MSGNPSVSTGVGVLGEGIRPEEIPRTKSPLRARVDNAVKLFINVPRAKMRTFFKFMCVTFLSRTILASVLLLIGLALVGTGLAIVVQGGGQKKDWIIGVPFLIVGVLFALPSLFEFCRLLARYKQSLMTL